MKETIVTGLWSRVQQAETLDSLLKSNLFILHKRNQARKVTSECLVVNISLFSKEKINKLIQLIESMRAL